MPDFSQFIFVDFENVQEVDLDLVRDKPVHVTLLIGQKQTKVPTRLALQFKSFSAQVEPIEVGGSGRNALDLTLAMYLGKEIQRRPAAHFAIVSRDTDFDPLVAHLQAANVTITRVTTFAGVPFFSRPKKTAGSKPSTAGVKPAPAAAKPPSMARPPASPLPASLPTSAPTELAKRQHALLARLNNPTNRNRPATRKSLASHLKTALGKNVTDAEVSDTLSLLETRRVLSIDGQGKINYAG